MIKGVNHQIIEIRQTDDPYFERALLFVRSAYAEENEAVLQAQGHRFVEKSDSYAGLRQNKAMCWFKRAALVLGGAFCGTLFGALLVSVG